MASNKPAVGCRLFVGGNVVFWRGIYRLPCLGVSVSLPLPASMRKMPESSSGDGSEGDVVVVEEGEKVTLDELKKRMAEFTREREWDQFHSPRNLLLALVGEVGELSEIFQWKGEVARGLDDWKGEEKRHLGEELSDVLLYLVRLADVCGIDLGKAALRKLELNATKYPVKQSKGSSKKYTHIHEITTHVPAAVADPSSNSDSNGPSAGL